MTDISFIAQEAHKIHDWFSALFYLLLTTLLLLGVLLEYFKLPLGGTPAFGQLVGRALIAAILLNTYPQISNLLCDISHGLSDKIGGLNEFQKVLSRLGDKQASLSFSWVSVKESVIAFISYLCFFLLYFSVHIADAFYLHAITLLYVFSPLLIVFFVLPQTAGCTKALYRSLIEVSLWKPVWAVLATLLWSTGVSDVAKSEASFLTAICFCLLAAASLLITPFIIHMLSSSGITGMASTLSTIAIPGIANINAGRVGKTVYQKTVSSVDSASSAIFQRVHGHKKNNNIQKERKI